jgi:hypothetical protein
MACLIELRNIGNSPTILDAEIEGLIADASLSSLSATQAAAKVLQCIDGAVPERVLSAAIHAIRDAIREQTVSRNEIVDSLNDEISDLEDKIADLKIEIGDLHAKLKIAAGRRP